MCVPALGLWKALQLVPPLSCMGCDDLAARPWPIARAKLKLDAQQPVYERFRQQQSRCNILGRTGRSDDPLM